MLKRFSSILIFQILILLLILILILIILIKNTTQILTKSDRTKYLRV